MYMFLNAFSSSAMQRTKHYGPNSEGIKEY